MFEERYDLLAGEKASLEERVTKLWMGQWNVFLSESRS